MGEEDIMGVKMVRGMERGVSHGAKRNDVSLLLFLLAAGGRSESKTTNGIGSIGRGRWKMML